jgi:cytochrome c peroxidase
MGGTDNIKTSIGHNWNEGPINAPTVLNSSLNLAQFWDGRAKDLQAQAGGPIANPGEMAATHELPSKWSGRFSYAAEFELAFGSPTVDIERVTGHRRLRADARHPEPRFDRWLEGDTTALTENELAGHDSSWSGCAQCHNGPAAGGLSFEGWAS